MPKHNYTKDSGYDYNTCLTYKDANKILKHHYGKDWHWKISLITLNMKCSYSCILAQLGGYYGKEVLKITGTMLISDTHPMGESHPFGYYSKIDWESKILKRRAKFPK